MAQEQEQNGGRIPAILTALGKFLRGLKEYNLLELMKVLFAVFVFALVISFVRNPEMYIEKASYAFQLHENRLEREHAAKMNSRRVADQNISWYLNELRDITGADRAWMLEPHNGGSNSTTGTSFYYLNLTADEPADGYEPLDKGAFKDIPYSEYPLADLIDKKGRWYGPIDSMMTDDRKLYYRMKAQGMAECAVMAAHSMNLPVCYVGLTWYEGHGMSDPEKVGDAIHKYTMQIALALLEAGS